MSDSLKIFGVYLIILLVIIISSSCNPVKKVLNDNKKFEIVAREVVKRGYCVNDTVVIDNVIVDTVVDEQYIYETVAVTKDIDTTFDSGARLIVQNGLITVQCPDQKSIVKTVMKTSYIRDVKLETILKEENTIKSDSIRNLTIIIKEKDATIKEQKMTIMKHKAKFIGLISGLILAVIIYLIYKFKKFF